jgi:hypothetical protein
MNEIDGITLFICGPRCDHDWDGPIVELTIEEHGTLGATGTCSKCGAWAINVSMLERK